MSIKPTNSNLIAKSSAYPMENPPGYVDDKKGRASLINPANRYEPQHTEFADDGWESLAEIGERTTTQLIRDDTKSIINYIKSPDIYYDRSINPYRGCEHGCIYCYARPSHAYLGFSPGLDFETKILYKDKAAELLRKELAAKKYRCAPIAIGANTDPYQQAEKKLKLTRSIIEVLLECRHPVAIITKSALILRDKDILVELAKNGLVNVHFSITSLSPSLNAAMEPRTAAPARRLQALEELSDAGVPCGVMIAPIIPFINDEYIEKIMDEASKRGALNIGYVFLRLPWELKEIFATWIFHHFPERAERVMNRIMDSRDGKLYDSAWGERMRGTGHFSELIRARFNTKRRQLGLPGIPSLREDLFRPPRQVGDQLGLGL